ncbi:hypothetical protein PRIPAC_95518 [Pristionchus pacificus]|uniref:Uncharacterized protein n=1 Tax=Pristionchus pacificus TaxID=54126 RepID=A0A2A6BIV9_PRIPA|nr:hypothetical protein PRIPAC_95518 [Pristionchus pacificus]|eukprot:PDM65783.1 hypothetical protein PRIPAC_45184 [Pristionchus pacificus]
MKTLSLPLLIALFFLLLIIGAVYLCRFLNSVPEPAQPAVSFYVRPATPHPSRKSSAQPSRKNTPSPVVIDIEEPARVLAPLIPRTNERKRQSCYDTWE